MTRVLVRQLNERCVLSSYLRGSAQAVVGARSHRQPDATLLSKYLRSVVTGIYRHRCCSWRSRSISGCFAAT
jgi:hypothetical protein